MNITKLKEIRAKVDARLRLEETMEYGSECPRWNLWFPSKAAIGWRVYRTYEVARHDYLEHRYCLTKRLLMGAKDERAYHTKIDRCLLFRFINYFTNKK